MKLKLLVAALGVAVSCVAMADSYQADLGASAARWVADGENSSTNDYAIDGKYYFNRVTTDNLPLAEAAYLNKSSNVFAKFSKQYAQGFAGDGTILSGGVEVYIPENFLYIKVEGQHSDFSGSDNSALTTLGLTPFDGLRVTTSWNSDEGYHANISGKYVTSIGNGQFINVEASVVDTDWGTYKSIGGDFYFNRAFSVGAEIGDDNTGTDYTIRTRKFFSETFSGELSYAKNDFGNTVALGVNLRF